MMVLGACLRAKGAYENPEFWAEIQKNAMEADFSWAQSAELYLGLYRELESWNQG